MSHPLMFYTPYDTIHYIPFPSAQLDEIPLFSYNSISPFHSINSLLRSSSSTTNQETQLRKELEMSPGKQKGEDLYGVLGLGKECTSTDLKNAYKKLAMRWHPDRLSASGNFRLAEEAKKKFQAIQEAYSVLSDQNKRFLYDVGMYDKEDDDNNKGMGEFLDEMTGLMNQENGQGTFEEFQDLFDNIFRSNDTQSFASSSSSSSRNARFQNFCG